MQISQARVYSIRTLPASFRRVLIRRISIAGVVYLAANDHAGWGWLIFLALVIA
jgi:hypothetical protein